MCVPCKEEEDNGMGIEAAQIYAAVAADYKAPSIAVNAAKFYIGVIRIHRKNIAYVLEHKLLTKAQTDSMMAQIDLACYRADDLVKWARDFDGNTQASKIAAWTSKLFEWAKNDQTFYTALWKSLGHWYIAAKDAD